MQFKATNIKWDTDGEDVEELGLPTETLIEADDEFEVADVLSDKFGWGVSDLDVNTHFIGAYRIEGDPEEEMRFFPVWAESAEGAVYQCCNEHLETEWAQAYTPAK